MNWPEIRERTRTALRGEQTWWDNHAGFTGYCIENQSSRGIIKKLAQRIGTDESYVRLAAQELWVEEFHEEFCLAQYGQEDTTAQNVVAVAEKFLKRQAPISALRAAVKAAKK